MKSGFLEEAWRNTAATKRVTKSLCDELEDEEVEDEINNLAAKFASTQFSPVATAARLPNVTRLLSIARLLQTRTRLRTITRHDLLTVLLPDAAQLPLLFLPWSDNTPPGTKLNPFDVHLTKGYENRNITGNILFENSDPFEYDGANYAVWTVSATIPYQDYKNWDAFVYTENPGQVIVRCPAFGRYDSHQVRTDQTFADYKDFLKAPVIHPDYKRSLDAKYVAFDKNKDELEFKYFRFLFNGVVLDNSVFSGRSTTVKKSFEKVVETYHGDTLKALCVVWRIAEKGHTELEVVKDALDIEELMKL